MSLHCLAIGALIGDPVQRNGAKGPFATATIRVATEDGSILCSLIAFGDTADRLLAHHIGQVIAVSGRARLSSWTGRDEAEHHGLAMVVDDIASAAGARRADAERRSRNRSAA